jgi:hypothetical protein
MLFSKSNECLPLSLLSGVDFRVRKETTRLILDDEFEENAFEDVAFEDVAFEDVANVSSLRFRFTVAGTSLLFWPLQLGVDISPGPANCSFCHSDFGPGIMSSAVVA